MRLHDSLMVVEIALPSVLLTGAGLAIRGFIAIQNHGWIRPSPCLSFAVPLSDGHYLEWAGRLALYQDIISELRQPRKSKRRLLALSVYRPTTALEQKLIFAVSFASQAPDVSLNLVQGGSLHPLERS